MTWAYKNSDEYIELVRCFPLTPITSREQHKVAMTMLYKLAISESMSRAQSDYFDVLSGLVRAYEQTTIRPVTSTPQKVLAFLMEQHDLNQMDIARIVDQQRSHVSEFFAGKRNLPKQAASILAAKFKVDPALFLPRVEPTIVETIGKKLTELTRKKKSVLSIVPPKRELAVAPARKSAPKKSARRPIAAKKAAAKKAKKAGPAKHR